MGDEIQLFIREEFFDSPEKDEGALARIKPKLNILYEDENIMLLDKKVGLLSHPDEKLAVENVHLNDSLMTLRYLAKEIDE